MAIHVMCRAIVDLAYLGNGAKAVDVSNSHYTPGSNVLLPGRGQNMGDGWETKRSRTPGHVDYVTVRLGAKGHLLKAELDTSHYCGNYPNKVKIEGTNTDAEIPAADAQWTTLVEPVGVGAHDIFYFDLPHTDKVFTHAKITIIPGKSRHPIYYTPA
jgi:allantoicase